LAYYFLLILAHLIEPGAAWAGPVNDVCSGAITLPNNVSFSMSTTNATSLGDPLATCSNLGAGVWFSVTPDTSGLLAIDTCQSQFDTVMQVFTGDCALNTPIACDDDGGPVCNTFQASVQFEALAGTRYLILVGGYQGASGNLTIRATWQTAAPPPMYLSGTMISNGVFSFILNGPPKVSCIIQASSNFVDWTAIATPTIGSGGSVALTDTTWTNQNRRFYRAFAP
jgi:hypothetical protein